MAKVTNYDTLVSVALDTLEDTGEELSPLVPQAIQNAELRLTEELDDLGFKYITTVSGTSGTRLLSKPDEYRVGFDITYTTSTGETRILKKSTDDYLRIYWPMATSTGEPVYYADWDDNNFLLAPTPDDDYGYVITYARRPTPLSSSVSVNWFTSVVPHALFYGTMVELARIAKQWNQVGVWDSAYQNAVLDLQNEARRARRDDGLIPRNPETPNTLRGTN